MERKVGDGVIVRPMEERDVAEAARVMGVAFGTMIGLPDPAAFLGDRDYVRHRWQASPAAAFVAELDGEVVGSNFATRWGSLGLFGPLTTRPDLWDQGIARRLIDPVMDQFAGWQVQLAGLFTSPNSPKHLGLYHRYGYRPRFLTAVMARPVEAGASALAAHRFSALSTAQQAAALDGGRRITGALFAGLDLTAEIRAIADLGLGDTLLLGDPVEPMGFACCHVGAGTQAGSGACFVKFAAVRPGDQGARDFARLLSACMAFAASQGASRLVAGVNTARPEAYEAMLASGFRTAVLGIAMHRPNEAGYSRPGVYVLDDWR
jgi:GNAT superfamily N-acetyltransferase